MWCISQLVLALAIPLNPAIALSGGFGATVPSVPCERSALTVVTYPVDDMKIKELFEYPLTKPIPYGAAFHILYGLLQIVVLGIFVVWGAATAGYDTITVASPDYNLTQELWYSRFVPSSLQSQLGWRNDMCSGVISLTPGVAFSTTNDLFSYNIGSYYTEPGETSRPADVVEYKGTALDKCAPSNVLVTVDVLRNTVDAVAIVLCYDDWPIVASNHYTFSSSPVKSILDPAARSTVANTVWTNENSSNSNIVRALDYLAGDVLSTGKLVRAQTNGSGPTEYGVNLQAGAVCPINYLGRPGCPPDAANWLVGFRPDLAVNTYANGSLLTYGQFDTVNQDPDMAIPIRNLAVGVHSATVYDLGSTTRVNNNIFTNLAAQSASLRTTNTNATTPGVLGSTLTGALAFTTDLSFPIPATGPTVVRATYLCRIKQLKSVAGFIFAVAGLAMSLFGTFMTVTTIGIVMILRAKRKDAMHCRGHQSVARPPSPSGSYHAKLPATAYSPVPTLPPAQSPQSPYTYLQPQFHSTP